MPHGREYYEHQLLLFDLLSIQPTKNNLEIVFEQDIVLPTEYVANMRLIYQHKKH